MQPPKRKRKWVTALGVSFLVLLVLALTLQIIGSAYLKPMLARQLQHIVLNGSDSLYRLSYTDISVNLWTGSVRIEGINLRADSTRFQQLQQTGRLPSLSLRLHADEMRIRGFNILRFVFSRDLHMALVSTENADLGLYRHYRKPTADSLSRPAPLWKLIRPNVKSIFVKNMRLDNIRLAYYNMENGKELAWKFDRFDTHISDIQIDSASSLDNKRLLYANNIEVEVRNALWYTPDSLYRLSARRFSYSLQKGRLSMDSLELAPTFDHREFYRRTRTEKDIYTLRMPKVLLINLQPERFVSQNVLLADSLLVHNGELDIYHDRQPPDDPVSKLGKFPHQLLLKAPIGISIKTAEANNMRIVYTEKNDLTLQEGRIYFTGIEGTATHITNLPHEIAQSGICEVWVKGRFMNETGINGKFMFDLTRPDGSFSAEAHMTPTDVTVLNPVTEALGSARFKSLKTGQVYYRIHGNEHGAYGYLEIPYTNLHMQILHLPQPGKDPRHKHFMTWMVKNFSFNENPRPGEELRIARNVYHKRHIQRSFFNLIWKTMYACAKDVATKEGAKKYLQKRKERLRKDAKPKSP